MSPLGALSIHWCGMAGGRFGHSSVKPKDRRTLRPTGTSPSHAHVSICAGSVTPVLALRLLVTEAAEFVRREPPLLGGVLALGGAFSMTSLI